MERSVYRFSLDIRDSIGACQPEMKQGDTHRRLYIDLTDGSMPYPIGDGCRVVFTAKKPDGTVICNACRVENNTVIYDITPQTTSQAGILNCELQLYDGTAEPLELITSAAFRIHVHPRVFNEKDPPASESESTGISAMLHQAEQAIEDLAWARDSGEFDGISATHRWNGTVLTVTSGSGTSSADLKGEKGDPGASALDDTTVGDTGWSSKHILDVLCPGFDQEGSIVQCQPVPGYPLEVISHLAPSLERHTAVTLTQCGKNLYDKDAFPITNGKYIAWASGLWHGSGNNCCILDFMPVAHLRGQRITLNHYPYEGTSTYGSAGMAFYDEDQIFISGAHDTSATVPENAVYMRFSSPKKYADGSQIQFELGDTITDYEPYWEKTYTVELDSDCYGGSFDWGNGQLTVTHEKVAMASLDWQYNELNCYFYADLPDGAMPDVSKANDAISNAFTWEPDTYGDITTGGVLNGGFFDISDEDGTCRIAVACWDADTAATFLDILTGMDAELVYPLAEPYTIMQDAVTVPATAGINTLYSNAGDTHAVGRIDPAATLEAITNAIVSLGGNI